MAESFHVFVRKDYLKFSAAHFIAYPGFREALHGHNYSVSIEIAGPLGPQGYVVDFGTVKKIARQLCDRLDERLLLPAKSDCLEIREDGKVVFVRYENDEFQFPRHDVLLLPIVHTSAEEIARYLAGELDEELRRQGWDRARRIEVGVQESQGQAAYYRYEPEEPS